MLFVRPPWWGSGLAARLHRLGLEEAARQGYETIRLYTPHGAARARAFYEREGWELAGGSFAEPLLGLDLVEYRRDLPARLQGFPDGTRMLVIPEGVFSDAAVRSRVSMRTRWERVRAGWRTMIQAAVAVALSWAVAKWLWGHPAPFFAPVSAIIALGQSYYERGRRAVELVVAVSLGVGVADLLAYELGTGVPQLALAVFLAVGLGMFFGTSALFVNQVAISAALVFTISTPDGGVSFARTLDALTGGLIALAVAALILPADPLRIVRDAARPVLDELASTLSDIAGALRQARSGAGRGGAGASPRHRRARRALLRRDRREPRDRPHLARAQARARTPSSPTPRPRGEPTSPCATCACWPAARCGRWRWTRTCPWRSRTPSTTWPARSTRSRARLRVTRSTRTCVEPALRAAATATVVLEGTANLSVSVIVGQIRSTATDLLTGTGMSYEEAVEAVRSASR